MKRGFTLVELLVIVAIISLLIGLLIPVIRQLRQSQEPDQQGVFRCVKTYEVYSGGGGDASVKTSKRVNLQQVDEVGNEVGIVVTMLCDDSYFAGITNSDSKYAQFEPGNYYKVVWVGDLSWNNFPYIKSVSKSKRPVDPYSEAEMELP